MFTIPFHSRRDDRANRRLQERRRRFAVEPLEGRQMLSAFTVTSTANDPPEHLAEIGPLPLH
jgi:hypothetical protein